MFFPSSKSEDQISKLVPGLSNWNKSKSSSLANVSKLTINISHQFFELILLQIWRDFHIKFLTQDSYFGPLVSRKQPDLPIAIHYASDFQM